jgi:hypothetical protein
MILMFSPALVALVVIAVISIKDYFIGSKGNV